MPRIPRPNEADYTTFLTQVVGIPVAQMPNGIVTDVGGNQVLDDSGDIVQSTDWVAISLEIACALVNPQLAQAWPLYVIAVYNLAADRLITFAPDIQGQTFFLDLRKEFKIGAFSPGVVSATADQGTSASFLNVEVMKDFSLLDLANLKTPYGREYLGIAQSVGTLWGLS